MSNDLSKMKAGDEVVLCYGGAHQGPGAIFKVSRVTPGGVIVVGNKKFSKHGRLRGASRLNSLYLELPTDEHRRRIRRYRMINVVSRVRWEELTDAALADVHAIVTKLPEVSP